MSGQIFQNNIAIHWMKDIWKWWGAPRTHITLGVAEWSNNFLGLPTPWRLLVQRIKTPFQRHQQPQNVRSFLTCKQIKKITFKGRWVAQKALRWNVVLFLFDAHAVHTAHLSEMMVAKHHGHKNVIRTKSKQKNRAYFWTIPFFV